MNLHDRTSRHTHGGSPSPAQRPPHRAAFTLVELLVVIAILILLFGVGLPALNGMLNSGRAEAGLTAVSAGASAARAYATRTRPFLTEDIDTSTPGIQTSDEFGDGYSGAAALITPAGEIRLVENDEAAINGGNNFLEFTGRNGYRDIAGREYIEIPNGSAVVGIARNDVNPDDLLLLAPPFAIRFNQHGSLIAGQTGNRLLYYDGDYNGTYETSRARGNPYGGGDEDSDSAAWDPGSPSYEGDYESDNDRDSPDPRETFDTAELEERYEGRNKLPFEAIETVVGVIAFDYSAFTGEGYVLEYELDNNDDAWEWILENGEPLFFNRQTGTVVKEQ